MNDWKTLIKLFAEHQAESKFIAECVYVYLLEHAQPLAEDDQRFLNDLNRYLEGDCDEISTNR
jgi:hypothetical protein